MIHMGDEYGHTKGGNNNTYSHDNYVIKYSKIYSDIMNKGTVGHICLLTALLGADKLLPLG